MTPAYPLSGNRWALNVPFESEEEDEHQVHQVPGIVWDQLNSRVVGRIDAITAACMRLGVEPPQRPLISERTDPRWFEGKGARIYQIDGVRLAWEIQHVAGGALQADEMGLGKTRQAILLAQLRGSTRIVVVCPGRARYTWQDELLKWGEPIDQVALMLPKGAKGQAKELAKAHTARWVITSYDLLQAIPGARYPDHLFIDECHEIKSTKAQRTRAAADLAASVPYRLGISATPAWNRPRDWWQVLTIILGRGVLGSKWEFERAYCNGQQGRYGWEADGLSRAEELKARLACYMVRREKKEVASELPAKSRQMMWLDADPRASSVLKAHMINKSVSFQAAKEACLDAKIPAAVELAHQAKSFLLFTYRKDHAEAMHRQLYENGTPNVLLTGDVSDHQRRERVNEAQVRRIGIVATIDCAGVSLNLQGITSYGIMHYLDHVPFKMLQAEDRIHRLGISEAVQWIYLGLKDSADEMIWSGVLEKMDQIRATMPAVSDVTNLQDDTRSVGWSDEDAMARIYEQWEHRNDNA